MRNADVKYLGLTKYTAKELSKGARQVGEGGILYWVRPAGSKATMKQMKDFLKNYKPIDKAGNVIKNVEIKLINERDLPKAFGR